jgi:hypothetical protein
MVHIGWGEIDTDTGDQYLQVIAGVGSSAVFMGLGSIYGDAKYIHITPQILSSDRMGAAWIGYFLHIHDHLQVVAWR